MKNKDWYIISDFPEFINATRALVYNSFGKKKNETYDEIGLESIDEHEMEEFDRVLSYDESVLIAKEFLKEQTNKKTQKKRYLLTDNLYHKIINAMNHRMVGNILNGLVNKGLIESSFDDKVNDFVFWVKEDNNPEQD